MIEELLDVMLGAPFGGRPPVLIYEAKKEETPEDGLGLHDKRIAITKEYTRYVEHLDLIRRTRDRAKATGLLPKFTQILKDVLGDRAFTIKSPFNTPESAPYSFVEATKITRELIRSGLIQEINDAESQSGWLHRVLVPPKDPKVKAAVDFLSGWPKLEPKQGPITMGNLLNPRGIDPDVPIEIRYVGEDGRTVKYAVTGDSNLSDHLLALKAAFRSPTRKYLEEQLIRMYNAMMLVIAHYFPQMTETQIKYTAMFYSIRNIADKLTSDEALRDATKKSAR